LHVIVGGDSDYDVVHVIVMMMDFRGGFVSRIYPYT
jgi:hypothetical protein